MKAWKITYTIFGDTAEDAWNNFYDDGRSLPDLTPAEIAGNVVRSPEDDDDDDDDEQPEQ